MVGAYIGLVLAQLNFGQLYDLFLQSGFFSRGPSAFAFYLEAGAAYLGAVAAALLGRRVGEDDSPRKT